MDPAGDLALAAAAGTAAGAATMAGASRMAHWVPPIPPALLEMVQLCTNKHAGEQVNLRKQHDSGRAGLHGPAKNAAGILLYGMFRLIYLRMKRVPGHSFVSSVGSKKNLPMKSGWPPWPAHKVQNSRQ